MFDNFLFDENYFDEVSLVWWTTQQDDIVYNSYWLQNTNICVNSISYDNWHNVSSDTYSNPLTDLWWELNYYFREKIVTLTWTLKWNNAEDLNNRIDELKQVLWQNNKDLDIKVNWTIRRAKASCININSLFDRKHYNITWIPFTIQFRVVSSFFKELTMQTQSFTWLTAWYTEEITNRWTVRTNPTINILISSTTWTNQITFNIWDNTLTINKSLTASDTIIIDCVQKTVKINNIDVDYSWVFPILEVWVNSYTIWINGTVNYNITLSYFNNYL